MNADWCRWYLCWWCYHGKVLALLPPFICLMVVEWQFQSVIYFTMNYSMFIMKHNSNERKRNGRRKKKRRRKLYYRIDINFPQINNVTFFGKAIDSKHTMFLSPIDWHENLCLLNGENHGRNGIFSAPLFEPLALNRVISSKILSA